MAFPVVASVTATNFNTNTTQHLVAMPATVDAGDLLVMFFGVDGTGAVTTPTDWDGANVPSAANGLAVYWKIAVGNEDGTTVDVVTAVTETAAAQVYRVTNWHGTTLPEVGVGAIGNSTTPNPPSLAPSWGAEDTLWLAGTAIDGQVTISDSPDNYTDLLETLGSAGSQSARLATLRRELNASSDDPTTFTISVIEQWSAQLLAVRPSAGGTPEGTGTSSVVVTTSATGQATHETTGSSNVVVTTSATGQTPADEGTGSSSIVVTASGDGTNPDAVPSAAVIAREAVVVANSNDSSVRKAQIAREAVNVAHHFPELETDARLARLSVVIAISRPHGWDVFDDPPL